MTGGEMESAVRLLKSRGESRARSPSTGAWQAVSEPYFGSQTTKMALQLPLPSNHLSTRTSVCVATTRSCRSKMCVGVGRESRAGPCTSARALPDDEVLLHPLPPWVVNRAGYSGRVAGIERVSFIGAGRTSTLWFVLKTVGDSYGAGEPG